MRKLTVILMALCLTACSQRAVEEQPAIEPQNQPTEKTMKTLVTYFSASGVTKGVAEKLAAAAAADLREIQPEEAYTEADLDWHNKKSRSSVEMQDSTSRPDIVPMDVNVADYDVIYVGFPIWWYTCPTIINTFMESQDFTGKTVIPFATSGGSTIDKACEDLKAAYPNVNWEPGRLLNNPTEQDIEQWVKEQ